MNLMNIDVDGSLRNPVVLWTIIAWTAVLIAAAVVIVLRRVSPVARFTRIGTVAVVLLLTAPVQFDIVGIVYRLRDPAVMGVGLWGGPPIWLAPLAFTVAETVTTRLRRGRVGPHPSTSRDAGPGGTSGIAFIRSLSYLLLACSVPYLWESFALTYGFALTRTVLRTSSFVDPLLRYVPFATPRFACAAYVVVAVFVALAGSREAWQPVRGFVRFVRLSLLLLAVHLVLIWSWPA